MNGADDATEYASAPAADLRIVSFCRECGCEISAEVAAANGGNCRRHASGYVWRDSDDVGSW